MMIFIIGLIIALTLIVFLNNNRKCQIQNLNNVVINNIKCSEFTKFQIPSEIINLLWFSDWKLKNYNKKTGDKDKIFIDELGIYISFTVKGLSDEEPSLLSIKLPIQEGTSIESLGYYPSYEGMTPIQRYQYLCWLRDIEQPVDIGYVFVFYYGLERHIFLGDYERAFYMILKLRQFHNYNNSFNSYSADCLIACCLVHDRRDLFQIIKEKEIFDSANDLFLYAEYYFKIPLLVEDLFNLHYKLQIQNKRYIKQYPDKFKEALKQVLIEINNDYKIDLSFIDISKCPKKQICLCANISLQDYRWRDIPIIINDKTRNIFVNYFSIAHERVKEELKNERKSRSLNKITKN